MAAKRILVCSMKAEARRQTFLLLNLSWERGHPVNEIFQSSTHTPLHE